MGRRQKAWQRKVARPPAKSVVVQYSSGRLQPNCLKLLGTATRISTPHPNVCTFVFVKQEILVDAVPRNFLTAIRLRPVRRLFYDQNLKLARRAGCFCRTDYFLTFQFDFERNFEMQKRFGQQCNLCTAVQFVLLPVQQCLSVISCGRCEVELNCCGSLPPNGKQPRTKFPKC